MELKIYTPDHSIRLVDEEEFTIAKHIYGDKAVLLGLPTGGEPEGPKPILMELLYTKSGKVLRKRVVQNEDGTSAPDYS